MTVEERRCCNARGNEAGDQFPVGMRVLAVDDDPTCLKMLEGLLRRCQYHVTTTNQAIVALKMLRENRDKFDLVISDVHMPDMDGFRLLELVGLEMDLPVIMLSGNSDPKAVMKGITHGACDYLLKPVRIEELKNIWQHVVRRRKFDSRDHNNYDHGDDCDKHHAVASEAGSGLVSGSGASDRNGKLNRKRKDQNEEDEGDYDENCQESEDPSSQKKPRVVWSIELHRKFVAAVNQLGIDKAMPKKILDLMNVDKLTRENVASHLQKYRLYLKRISNVANQQANMVAALGAKDSPYLQMSSLDGARNYHGFSGAGHLPVLTPFQQAATLGRLNAINCSGNYGLGSSGMIQLGRMQNSSNSPIQDLGRLPQISFGGTPKPNLLQGIPTSLESSQLLHQKVLLQPNNPLPGSFPDSSIPFGSMNNSFNLTTNNPLILHSQQQQQQQQSNGFSNQISAELSTLSVNPFEIGSGASSNLPELVDRCGASWQGAAPLTGYPTNMLPLSTSFSHENDIGDTLPSVTPATDKNITNVHPSNSLTSAFPESVINQTNSLEGNLMHVSTTSIPGDSTFLHAGNTGSLTSWNDQRKDPSTVMFQSSPGSSLSNLSSMHNISHAFNNGLFESKPTDMSMNDRARFTSLSYPQNMGQGLASESRLKNPVNIQEGFSSTELNLFDELMSAIVKPEREDILPDGDIGCDMYPLETCM